MELGQRSVVQEVRTEAAKKMDRELGPDIMGCDIVGQMLKQQVSQVISAKQMRVGLAQTRLMALSFPIHHHIGERCLMPEVTKLYAEWDRMLCTTTQWSKRSDEAFESKYGSSADKKRKLYNGTLKSVVCISLWSACETPRGVKTEKVNS